MIKRDLASVASSLNNLPYQGTQSAGKSNNPQAAGQAAVSVAEVKHRNGTVLDPSTLIKVDDYLFKLQPSRPNWFPRRIAGAEELRVVEGTSIIGVAQPTLPGIRGILDSLHAGRNVMASAFDSNLYVSKKRVLWINLREEPLLYLNGRPVVLREREEPFRNMETFKGINESRLRDLEWRFKEDVVAEAQQWGGSVLIHEEESENILVEKWESAPPNAVLTPEDVFFQLRQEGYRVRYERLPCTSGQSPSAGFFDELLKFLMTTDRDTWVVFNCQSGNGRSTLAMIATYAIQTRRGLGKIQRGISEQPFGQSDPPTIWPVTKKDTEAGTSILVAPSLTPPLGGNLTSGTLVPPALPSPAIPDEEKDETARQLMAGWYLPVLQLIRLLVSGGREAKSCIDLLIDSCSHTTNMRTEVLKFRAKAANAREKSYRSLFVLRASVSLQRYMLLILFEAYLTERAQREGAGRQSSFGHPLSKTAGEELGPTFESTTDLEGLNPMLRVGKHNRSVSRDIFGSPMLSVLPVATTFTPDYRPSFSEWLESRREIISLLRVITIDPETALESPAITEMVGTNGIASESHKVLQSRRGTMLNTDTILKLDDFEHNSGPGGEAGLGGDATVDQSKGGRNFRRVPGMRVYGVATPSVFNAKNLIRLIQTTHGAEKLLFCNLREEPFVYINDRPFVLRSIHRPFRNLNAFADIDVARLEKAEEEMKREILAEAARYDGKILVHVESADGSLKVIWEDVEDEETVKTPKEVFASFSIEEILPVSYARIPMTPESEPGLSDIDEVIRTVHRNKDDPGMHFVFFCQRGRGRSTIATIVACLELDEFFPTDESESLSLMRGATMVVGGAAPGTSSAALMGIPDRETLMSPAPEMTIKDAAFTRMQQNPIGGDRAGGPVEELASFHTDFPPMLSLMRVLRHGAMAKRWLDFTIDRCGAVFNIRKSILSQSIEAFSARTEEQSTAIVESALFELKRYFILLEVAGYCMEMKSASSTYSTKFQVSFHSWCSARPELQTLKDEIHDQSALVVISPEHDTIEVPSPVPELAAGVFAHKQQQFDNELERRISDKLLVANRKGRVLVRGSILKTDHFPGCKRLPDAKIDIEGAPNFRAIWPEGPLDGIDLRVYGTGIPTDCGMNSVLRFLDDSSSTQTSSKDHREEIVWVNLREEPILYLNGRPFVLRRLDEPFANLEHTGISRSRVEEMEIRLKDDIMEEATASGDSTVLIHEEDEDGGLRPKWEKVETVFTSKEQFDKFRNQFHMKYWRIPITDEQSPKPSAFDAIVDIVASSSSTSHIVFNCQMGRGRTTSGLIVASATRLRMIGALRRFASVVNTKVALNRKFRSKVRSKGASDLPPAIAKELRGDYLAITAQVRLMDDGVDAKRAMDALIDICDSMQNLREAIHEVKTRSAKVDLTPALRAEARGVAEHYLRRYAHLIQFAAYLLSIPDLNPKRVRFAQWLKSRPELGNALKSLIGDGQKSLLSS